MSINYNIFTAGLDGGTLVCTGDKSVALSFTGSFQGLRVSKQCYLSSILDQEGNNTITNVDFNGTLQSLVGVQLNTGDVISPYAPTTHFTGFTFTLYSNTAQIVAYYTGSL